MGIRMPVAGAQAKRKGKMVLLSPDDMIRRILKTTGLDPLVAVCGNLDEALGKFCVVLRAQPAHAGGMPDHASRVVGELNEQLCTHNDAQRFLTAFCRMLLYTDGVTEAENAQVDMLREDRLKARLNALRARQVRDLVDAVFDEVRAFVGEARPSRTTSRCSRFVVRRELLTLSTMRREKPCPHVNFSGVEGVRVC